MKSGVAAVVVTAAVLGLLWRRRTASGRRVQRGSASAGRTTSVVASQEESGSMTPPSTPDGGVLEQTVDKITTHHPLRRSQPNPLAEGQWPPQFAYLGPDEYVSLPPQLVKPGNGRYRVPVKYCRAGPRRQVFWDAGEVRAAIVTCGGLCPGLNTVVREIVMCLHSYGVKSIFGISSGYRGFYTHPLLDLTPPVVKNVHLDGGTMLGSSRGGFDLEKILDAVRRHKLNHLYVIGGDGTHRGALALVKGARAAGMEVAIAAVPKTIDNDVPFIDKSFGFDTAVEQAVRVINSAYVEATAHRNGLGIVKLMGRHSGAIAMHASMACRLVNVVLIPELPFSCEKVCQHVLNRLKLGKQSVIVVAEGSQVCSVDLCDLGLEEEGKAARDESGNKKMRDVGALLKDYMAAWFTMQGQSVTIKYLDPTYIIRSVPANPSDSILCSQLAYNAVHGVFAGFTGFTVGNINNEEVMLPIELVATTPSRGVDTKSPAFASLMINTRQPDLSPACS